MRDYLALGTFVRLKKLKAEIDRLKEEILKSTKALKWIFNSWDDYVECEVDGTDFIEKARDTLIDLGLLVLAEDGEYIYQTMTIDSPEERGEA